MKLFLFWLSLLLIFFSLSNAQDLESASINGFVYDKTNGEALIGVNVYLPELKLGSSTNTSGYFIISNIPPGRYLLIAEYLGYQSFSDRLNLKINGKIKLDIYLEIGAIQGEGIEVVADSVRTSIKLYEKAISNIQLNTRQIKAIPQVAEADLLRSLQTLPGIVSVSDFSSALYIRGGTPDQNLYLLDGTDVYNPEHAFGIFSTFNTDAIKHVELYKGGFGAAYGGRLSSILDVINLDGNREEFEGQAALSMLSAKTTLQMPVGNSGAISGSLRRTYFDKTIRHAIDEIPDYYFYDGNIKGFFELDPKNKITISGYGGRDYLDFVFNYKSEEKTGFKYDWGNKTGSIRWTRVFNPKLFANFWVTGSRFSSDFDLGETVPVVERNELNDVTLKGNLEYHYSHYLHSKFGFEQKNLHVIYRQDFPNGKVDVDFRPKHYVGYFQTNWRPSARWDIETGIRYNYFKSNKNFQDIEPRFCVKYRLTETINLKASSGIYKQYLHRIPRTFVSDIWTISNKDHEPSTSQHYILGFQKEVANHYQFEFETYYKNYQNIHSFNQTFITEIEPGARDEKGNPIYTSSQGLFHEGNGNSYGFELLFRKDKGVVTGWLGYSFAKTLVTIKEINRGREFSPRHDRHSTINLVSKFNIRNFLSMLRKKSLGNTKNRWIFGINFVYASGQPITTPTAGYIVGVSPNAAERYVEFYPSYINRYRLPAYARLDLSLTYRRTYKSWSMEPYLQVFNVGNRKNIWFINYEFENGVSNVETLQMFPILPTAGINFYF